NGKKLRPSLTNAARRLNFFLSDSHKEISETNRRNRHQRCRLRVVAWVDEPLISEISFGICSIGPNNELVNRFLRERIKSDRTGSIVQLVSKAPCAQERKNLLQLAFGEIVRVLVILERNRSDRVYFCFGLLENIILCALDIEFYKLDLAVNIWRQPS